jgi:hypothetical protein
LVSQLLYKRGITGIDAAGDFYTLKTTTLSRHRASRSGENGWHPAKGDRRKKKIGIWGDFDVEDKLRRQF